MKCVSKQLSLGQLSQRGMSLIEIMITMAIIGAMMALAASFLFPGNEAKMREETVRLAGVVKFVYNEAAIKNRYYRLTFDLDAGSYSVESSTDPFRITILEEGAKPPPAAPENPEASPTGATFTQETDQFLVQPHSLPAGVKFKDVFVLHDKDRQSAGKVFAYFFPNGWAEKMVVNFTDEDEESFYSVEVNPLTGKSKIRSEYYEIKEQDLKAGTGTP
jgi:prepilin-type N-terminal cleavage/methylation domain